MKRNFTLSILKYNWGYSQSTVNFCKLETITIRWISSFRTTDPIKNLTNIFLILTVDPCENSPCKNEGKCESDGGKFSCECKKGFTGKTCEIESDYVTYRRNLQGFSIMSVSTSYVVAVISYEFKMFLPVCM